jgi:hypothetical protein
MRRLQGRCRLPSGTWAQELGSLALQGPVRQTGPPAVLNEGADSAGCLAMS